MSNKKNQSHSTFSLKLKTVPRRTLKWGTDKDLEEETQRLFSDVYNYIACRPQNKEVNEILEELDDAKTDFRKYKDSQNPKKDDLDKAFSAVAKAHVKMVAYKQMYPEGLGITSTFCGIAFGVAVLWFIIRAIGALLTGQVFLVDLFFVAVYGALASIMLLIGRPAFQTSVRETISKLFASPLLAVVIVAILSELTIGIGNDLSSTGISSNIGALTLRGASDGMKMSFAFVFAFFSETTVELLKDLLGKSAKQP